MTPKPLSRWLAVEVMPSVLGSSFCVVAKAVAAELETEHAEVFEAVARTTANGVEAFTRDLPNVAEGKLKDLDERGLVRVGTLVGPGDLLVGRVTPRRGPPPSTEEKLLSAIFGEKSGDVDTSFRVPPGIYGMVTLARHEELRPADVARREVARASVRVSWVRPLEVGDVLVDEAGRRTIVAAIRDVAVDVAPGSGDRKVAKVAMARDRMHARSIGPYSIVTQRPLKGTTQFGGQPVSAGLLAALVGAGNPWAAWELATLKCDCVGGRLATYEGLVKGAFPGTGAATDLYEEDEREAATVPESVRVVERELFALGFATRIDGGPVTGAWVTSAQVRERSRGRVTAPETLARGTNKPVPGGLSCERIFGPVKDFTCACGKHTRAKDRGLVCVTCGVEVARGAVRRERFGHIELPTPIPHPWRLREVAAALGRTEAELRREGLSADDVQALGGDASALLLDAIPVLPADLRPVVALDNGRFATSDLNDLYADVIERAQQAAQRIEGNADASVLRHERVALFAAVEALFDNARVERPITYNGRQLHDLAHLVRQHLGASLFAKPVDYSGVANLVADPDIPDGVCRLPRRMAFELFKPWAYSLMEARGHISTIKAAKIALESRVPWAIAAIEDVARVWPVLLATDAGVEACRVTLWDAPAIAVSPACAVALASEAAVVHVPLSAPAVAGARALGSRVVPVPAYTSQASGWFSGVAGGADLAEALRAAGAGAVDKVDDPVLSVALGVWPNDPPAQTPWLTDDLVMTR